MKDLSVIQAKEPDDNVTDTSRKPEPRGDTISIGIEIEESIFPDDDTY